MRWLNVHEVLDRVCRLTRVEAEPGVQVTCDYDPSIPDLYADSDLLIQAFLNITRNALQMLGEKGEVHIRSRVQRQVTIGQRRHRLAARIDVVDDGPGIEPVLLEKVFYPLVSGRPGGTGLGLSIAQSLIQQHGGLIQCASRPGKTVMSALLPLENDR
jgi:two-component system nitrogen regulation sensor histidine kinase GlnL